MNDLECSKLKLVYLFPFHSFLVIDDQSLWVSLHLSQVDDPNYSCNHFFTSHRLLPLIVQNQK